MRNGPQSLSLSGSARGSPAFKIHHQMKVSTKIAVWPLCVLFHLAIYANSSGQVTLSPEIGLSYWPISARSVTSGGIYTTNRIDYLIGMSGAVPFHEKWSLNMRLSYSNRENLEWVDLGIHSVGNELLHSDINIDISVGCNAIKNISFLAGPSIVRKLNSSIHFHYYTFQSGSYTTSRSIDRFLYGFNIATSIAINKFIIRAEYAHFFWDQDDPDWGYFWGGHRYNLVLSYPVFTGKKR
jgi:hypothetical protein